MKNVGQYMYDLAKKLFPICRSITGNGFRQSLNIIQGEIPEIQTVEVPSGTKVFDWIVPKEWNIQEGYIETLQGEKIVDFNNSNLHVMGYSLPIDKVITREELLNHVYTIPEQPDWIPYVTSYYKERWGFCMSERQKEKLCDRQYHVKIDSSLTQGSLTYGELVIPGKSKEEIMFTSYLCHPSMANNELSGPVVLTELIKYIKSIANRRYTYRILLNPETIGSIVYLAKNLEELKQKVKAGFVISCVGDERTYSYIQSKYGNTLADLVAQNILKNHAPHYNTYSFLKRGSDERQFCSSGVDLPFCGICRSKYMEYPEYHTSADNMNLITPKGLAESLELFIKIVNALENNFTYKVNCKCEPQLGRRELYPTISRKGAYDAVIAIKDFIAYADGKNNLVEISNIIHQPVDVLIPIVEELKEKRLITYFA